MRADCRVSLIMALAVVASSNSTALGQGFTFTRIVDSTTAIPGGTGFFTSYLPPSLDAGVVAFSGGGSGGQQGIYTAVSMSPPVMIANTTTMIPSATGTFFPGFGNPVISAGSVSFQGTDGVALDGIYTNSPGMLTRVADTTMMAPGGGGATFGIVDTRVTLSAGVTTFASSYTGTTSSGVFANPGGTLTVIANSATSVPGSTGLFDGFGPPSISTGTVAFRGTQTSPSTQGIYTNPGGTLGVVANTTTAIPSGTGSFEGFGEPSISGTSVAFIGSAGGGVPQSGVYTNAGGPLTRVADLTTTIPGGTGMFTSFGDAAGNGIAISGGGVAFLGLNSSMHRGIYANIDGTLLEVIGPGDMLDGKVVGNFGLSFASTGIDGRDIAFSVVFTNLSRGIYIATLPVPEPTGILAASALIAVVGWSVRRRGRKPLLVRYGDR